jgi:hypothetical protein
MKLINKTVIQQNVERIEAAANTAILATASAAHALNNSHSVFWGLPDNELTELLQYLFDEGKLQDIFNRHYIAAMGLNDILDNGEYDGVRAIAVVGRAFEISEGGIVSLVLPVEEEVVEVLEPEVVV